MNKKVSILDVAKAAGVSKSTVSRVLNDSYGISQKSKEKVYKAIKELKYRPNVTARHLRGNINKQIGVLIPQEISNYFMYQMNSEKIQSIVKYAKKLGYDILLFIEDTSNTEALCEIVIKKGFAGILLLDKVPSEVLDYFTAYKIPFVQVNWYVADYKNQLYVKTDLAKATTMALDVLIKKGCKSVGLIQYEDKCMKESVIVNAFTTFAEKHNINIENAIWNMEYDDSSKFEEFLIRSKKEAYISFSYPTSVNIINYCKKHNIRIPEQLKLISYEFFEFFDYVTPKITGIKQQADEMGKQAVIKLVKLIEGETNIKSQLICPKIVFRETC